MIQNSSSHRIHASFKMRGRAWGRRVQERDFLWELISCTIWKVCNKRDKELQNEMWWLGQMSGTLGIPSLPKNSCRGVRQITQSKTVIRIIFLGEHYVIVYSYDFFFAVTTDKLTNIRGLGRGWVGLACLFLSLAAHQASLRNCPNQNVSILLKHPLLLKQVVIISVPLSSGSQRCLIP